MDRRAGRLALLIAAAVLALAPAGAMAQHDPAAEHDVAVNVVERQVTLAGGVRPAAASTWALKCSEAEEYAFSGSFSIDSISTGGPGVYNYITLLESRATDVGEWRFWMDNDSIATAEITLRIVCVTSRTSEYRFRFSQAASDHLSGGSVECEEGNYPVQAGFLGAEPSLMFPRLRSGELRPAWRYAFGETEADVSLRCLRATTRIYEGHSHELIATFKPKTSRVRLTPTAATVKCPQGSAAVAPAIDARRKNVRTIASAPRGRNWRFELVSLFKTQKVALGATCLVTTLPATEAEPLVPPLPEG